MTVYVVTSGHYSDYQIEGIFSTQEKADAFVAEFQKSDNSDCNDIEEWPLDSRCEEVMRLVYHAEIDLLDGGVKFQAATGAMVSKNDRSISEVENPSVLRNTVWASSAISPEHAMKLAVEARQAYLRKQAVEENIHAEMVAKTKASVAKYLADGGH